MIRPALTVVIPGRDAAGTIGAQLDALVDQVDAPPFEVVVSDNGSSDDTAAVAARWSDRLDVRVIDSGRARGVNTARNEGWRAAAAPLVAFCDADDRVDSGWVAAMVAALRDHPVVGGPVDVSSINPPTVRLRYDDFPADHFIPTSWRFPTLIGANMGFRRDLLARYDGFDESFRDGADDTQLAFRLALDGVEFGWAPDAVVHYALRRTRRALFSQYRAYGEGEVRLYVTFRDHGMIRRPLPRAAVSWLAAVARFVWFVGPRRQGKALRSLGYNVGRARGSIRHRVLFP